MNMVDKSISSYGPAMYSFGYVRDTINGKIIHGKCEMCDGTGYVNWDENGEDLKPGRSNSNDRDNGYCENCDGLGFLIIQDNRE